MAVDWFERAVLTGPNLVLSPLSLADAADFAAALGTPDEAAEVLQHLRYDPPADTEQAREHLAGAIADPDRIAYGQRLRATGELVGTTSFYEISPTWRALAIGHTWVARRHWRTGVNTEAKLLLLTRAFEGLGAERVIWHTDIRNDRSQRAIERLGAQREGVLRHHRLRRDGSWRDTVQYSMLQDEWPAARARLSSPHDREEPLTMPDDDTLTVNRHAQLDRYEARVGTDLVTVIDFTVRDDILVVTHTGTDPEFRGRGYAAQATEAMLNDLRATGQRVQPVCPFTVQFMDAHPEFDDLRA